MKRDGVSITVEKRGTSSEMPSSIYAAPAACPVCKGPHWKRDCPRGIGLRVWTLKTIRTEGAQGSPHKLPS